METVTHTDAEREVDPHRVALLAGLRQLTAWLDRHPDVPVPQFGVEISYYVTGCEDATGTARIQDIAAAMDVPVTVDDERTEVAARQTFGPVSYRAMYITRVRAYRWEAERNFLARIRAKLPELLDEPAPLTEPIGEVTPAAVASAALDPDAGLPQRHAPMRCPECPHMRATHRTVTGCQRCTCKRTFVDGE